MQVWVPAREEMVLVQAPVVVKVAVLPVRLVPRELVLPMLRCRGQAWRSRRQGR
jgi:hypothetical protein